VRLAARLHRLGSRPAHGLRIRGQSSGVKQDRYWFNDSDRDDSWHAVRDVSVMRDRDGRLAEFRIPFSQLRVNVRNPGAPGDATASQGAGVGGADPILP